MSDRMRVALPQRTPYAGAPYQGSVAPPPQQSAADSNDMAGARRITPHNFSTFEKREKTLPPDACIEKAPKAKLFQFPDRVIFFCSKCRRDGVSSDSLAFDAPHGIMICVKCFERIVRPKKYRPSRVVPFPSLLSWLNYKPAPVLTSVSENVMNRPAEAAAPSGHRLATEMMSGGQTDIKALPATPMLGTTAGVGPSTTAAAGSVPFSAAAAVAASSGTHPCLRVWGGCLHGETCYFRGAPRDLCLAYLMGLCDHGAEGSSSKCSLAHQRVADLPTKDQPPERFVGDTESADSAISQWIAKKRNSANRVEWQLFRNGPLLALLDEYLPAKSHRVPEEEGATTSTAGGHQPHIALNVSNITSALRFLGKKTN